MQNKNYLIMKNLMLVISGSLILAFAGAFFYLPNQIVSGGLSGIAIILNHVIKVNVSFLNEEFYIMVLTWLFFVLGVITLGKKFTLQTLCSTIVYPIGIYLFSFVYDNVDLVHLEPTMINNLIAAIFGGTLTGVGVGLTFLGGGSTGGVDIPTLILYKYFKLRVSISSFLIDTLIIIFGIFVIQKYDLALIGILAAFLAAFAIDKVFIGSKSSYMAYIVSKKYDEINKFILDKMERGTTLFVSQGGYSKIDTKVILVCFDFKEYYVLKQAINQIDKDAFFSVVKAHEINGMGFSPSSEEIEKSQLDKWLKK